jgi:hypothetical protein
LEVKQTNKQTKNPHAGGSHLLSKLLLRLRFGGSEFQVSPGKKKFARSYLSEKKLGEVA